MIVGLFREKVAFFEPIILFFPILQFRPINYRFTSVNLYIIEIKIAQIRLKSMLETMINLKIYCNHW